ncbi:MAG: hypothetical protein KDC66_05655, partial [Phaeodactylibacter sp.]|nr:hypothetical protein [Phaeodactylibacter sp.]
MQIKEIISWHIRIPLRAEFVQSGNSATHSDSVIVAIILADGTTGYGECCPRAYVTGEDASTVLAGLAKARKLLAHTPLHSIETIREFVEERLSGHLGLAATCAIESALLDAFSKYAQAPITQLLAFDWPERIRYSGVAPMRPLHKMGPFLEQLRQFDFKEIKLKIGNCLADNLATIKLVKQYFGDHIRLRVDANCAWGLRDAVEQMPALIEAGATVFEQAFPPEKEEELARATALWGHEAEL